MYEWLGEDKKPTGIPPSKLEGFRNRDGQVYTIRVDSKVVHETDSDESKGDESRWMRLTLDTVGKRSWPVDPQGRPIYPKDFDELAAKLGRPLHPPGRDIRCIVSVGMLTEGWDCSTVTHIVGLRPFLSQLLCEQVVGRGLRRFSYEAGEDGRLTEEVAKVFGVPFEIIPMKANPQGAAKPPETRHHVRAIPEKARFEIRFPRVEGYTQAIRNRVTVKWEQTATYLIDRNEHVAAFVKNSGLGFAIPYFHNGQPHDYLPDFLIRLKGESPAFLILETKGFDPLEEVKKAAANRWVAAVNADGRHGRWMFELVKKVEEIPQKIAAAIR